MSEITQIYIDGAFVDPHGETMAPLFNPSTEEQIGTVRLGDAEDADLAVAAAGRGFDRLRCTSEAERSQMLIAIAEAVEARSGELADAMAREFGAPPAFIRYSAEAAGGIFRTADESLRNYSFRRQIGRAEIDMVPLGPVGAIIPWNATFGFFCNKLASALAAGCSIVIKPSEMSAIQTQLITECVAAAGLPDGVVNVVNGDGAIVGNALCRHPDIAKISFTGSTPTGASILHAAADTFKRVTLELGGKTPTIVLNDADLDTAIDSALATGFINSGQSCIAGTRILVPEGRLAEVEERVCAGIGAFHVGPPSDPAARIGPMVSQKQWDRVQSYIRLGLEEGATLLTGGEGRPVEHERGWFVRPTVFTGVNNDMRIANHSDYGLHAYIFGADLDRAKRLAQQIECGRVAINGAPHEPLAPFGGFKHSGIGREFGEFGIDAYLEPRAILS